MSQWSVAEWITFISAVSAAVCSIIAAIKSGRTNEIAKESNTIAHSNSNKLDAVKNTAEETRHLANGNVTEIREELRIARAKNEYLMQLVSGLTDKLPEGELEKVKVELEAIGRRRKDDYSKNREE